MTSDARPGDERRGVTRRKYLAATAGTGLLAAGRPGSRVRTRDSRSARDRPPTDRSEREDFLWLHPQTWRDERRLASSLAFARRHDLAVVVPQRAATLPERESAFRETCRAATAAGLSVWLRAGMLTDVTAAEFVEDPDARATHLDALRRLYRVYSETTDEGRVVLWEEAPVMGQWVEGGDWTAAAADAMLDHGPSVFAAQRRVAREVAPDRPVGIFVHFPYLVDSKSPETFATLTDRLAAREATPDFAFTDFYRGWYEKDVGPGPADDAVESLIRNASDELGGRPTFYLGQSHTVNPGHAPGRESIRSNLRASLAADVAGLGWYSRTEYVPTTAGFDPVVPNASDADVDDPVATATVARDRYLYAWLATLATRPDFDSAERFDLWLWADDLSFGAHRVSARADDGWRYLTHVDGYADGDYPYAAGEEGDASVIRALDREEFLDGDGLDVRIETRRGGDATLRAALAMPCDPRAYLTEPEAAARLAGDAPVESFALGAARERVPLAGGGVRDLRIPIRDADPPSLLGLRHPDATTEARRLARAERRSDATPEDLFDLWLAGSGLTDPTRAPKLRDRSGAAQSPAEASAVAVGTDEAAVFYRLPRDRFLGAGLALAEAGLGGSPGEGTSTRGPSVRAAYAMPHAGSAAFRPAAEAARLLREWPDEVATFSLDEVGAG